MKQLDRNPANEGTAVLASRLGACPLRRRSGPTVGALAYWVPQVAGSKPQKELDTFSNGGEDGFSMFSRE